MKPRTVLSMEQALSLSYGTLRLAQIGWRVIRLESAPRPGQKTPGDPNRYVGRPGAGPDRRSYFIAPNVGKEAMAIDLKQEEGRRLLRRIVRTLPVDLFACNTLPRRYGELIAILEELGADDEALRIKASGLLRGLHNYRTNRQGMLEGLVDRGILTQKKKDQEALAQWIAAEIRGRVFGNFLRRAQVENGRHAVVEQLLPASGA